MTHRDRLVAVLVQELKAQDLTTSPTTVHLDGEYDLYAALDAVLRELLRIKIEANT